MECQGDLTRENQQQNKYMKKKKMDQEKADGQISHDQMELMKFKNKIKGIESSKLKNKGNI